MSRPSNDIILERAVSFANEFLFTAELQVQRLREPEPRREDFFFRYWADIQLLVNTLCRLQRVVDLVAREVDNTLKTDLAAFNTKLPGLRNLRNVYEHIDGYIIGEGWNRSVSREGLQVGSWDGQTFTYLDHSLDIEIAFSSAVDLFRALQGARDRNS